ncbi:uncharacterized protein RHIMIDRAFT_242948, partial [Rhizopus microsporus ATCC 52813]
MNSNNNASVSVQARKRMRLHKNPNGPKCPCGRRFDSLARLNEHAVIHRASFSINPIIDIQNIPTDFYDNNDPMEIEDCPLEFKSSHTTSAELGAAHVYQCKPINENTFNYVQQMNIRLNNLLESYGASRELQRDVIRFINTVIRDKDRFDVNDRFHFPETTDNLMRSTLPIKAYNYDVCKNGCKMFEVENAEDTSCEYCGERRYEDEDLKEPVASMKLLSVGDYVSNMLAKEDTRQMFKYRSTRDTEINVYKDIFDGDVYKDLVNKGFFDGELDVALALFVDGFTTQHKGKRTMTIIHCVILNVDPSSRYTEEFTLQLGVIPGPKKPKDIDSFLQPIVKELKKLSTDGLAI